MTHIYAEVNLIADVAGQWSALQRLIRRMPAAPYLSLGDMVDRGPQSREVVEWFRTHGRALLGNHEHLALTALDGTWDVHGYSRSDWIRNGGQATLDSFTVGDRVMLPQVTLDWLRGLPVEHRQPGLVVTHAPLSRTCWDLLTTEAARQLWARGTPPPIPRTLQVYGHDGRLRWHRYRNGRPWAVCLDDSHRRVLTGMHWPSLQVFQEPFDDPPTGDDHNEER